MLLARLDDDVNGRRDALRALGLLLARRDEEPHDQPSGDGGPGDAARKQPAGRPSQVGSESGLARRVEASLSLERGLEGGDADQSEISAAELEDGLRTGLLDPVAEVRSAALEGLALADVRGLREVATALARNDPAAQVRVGALEWLAETCADEPSEAWLESSSNCRARPSTRPTRGNRWLRPQA